MSIKSDALLIRLNHGYYVPKRYYRYIHGKWDIYTPYNRKGSVCWLESLDEVGGASALVRYDVERTQGQIAKGEGANPSPSTFTSLDAIKMEGKA